MEGLKIAMGTANGAAYMVAPKVFTVLVADLTVIHCRPNGLNINDKFGSQHTPDRTSRKPYLQKKAIYRTGI